MLQLIISAIVNNLGTILTGLITYALINWFIQIRRLPPGPFPLPILGNLLSFIMGESGDKVIRSMKQKYGNIFTVRFGSFPFVIISDYELAKEALLVKKTDFAGRIKIILTDMILENGNDIAFVDYSEGWEVLKKMGHTAIRKYVNNDNMPEVVRKTADEIIDDMLKRKESFDPCEDIYLLMLSLSATSSFGQKYKLDSEEFIKFRAINQELRVIIGNGFPVDFIPILRPFYLRTEYKLRKCTKDSFNIISNGFQRSKDTYQPGTVRHFSDALLSSRDEALKEDPTLLKYMTDSRLKMVVNNLFNAGVATSSDTLQWAIRYFVKYPDIQEKMFREIQNKIGDRMVVKEDRQKLPYVWAALTEIFRSKVVVPFGLPHKTMVDTELGGYKIPKNTGILFHYDAMNNNPEVWPDPDQFKPERFLDEDGNFTKARLVSYVPFGMGRRSCVGEKLAKVNIFLIIVRLLQRCKFVADGEVDMRPLDKVITSEVRPCKLFVLPRN